MKDRFQTPTLIFNGLSALVIVIIVASCTFAIGWINRPFAGFMIYNFPYVGSISVTDWPGHQVGVKMRERVVAIEGQAVTEGQDVLDAVAKMKPGTPVRYTLESEGVKREVTVPVTLLKLKDLFLVFFMTYLGGVAMCALGIVVWVLKPNTHDSWVFFIMCICLGGYMVTTFDTQSSYSLTYINSFTLNLMAATFFHLGSIFPERKKILLRFPALEYLIYVPALIFALLWWVNMFKFREGFRSEFFAKLFSYQTTASFSRLFLLFCVVSLLVFVLHSLFKASTILARQRARMILFGASIAFLPSAVIMMLGFFFKVDFPWNFLVIFVIFFPASIAYSIVRHNLFDADEIIKRTVGYFIVTAIVIGAYALVSVIFNVFMAKYEVAQSRVFPILFTLGVILVFNPLRNRIQSLVDRIFFRKEYDYGAVVEKVSGAMTSLLDLPQILKQLTQTFIEDMFINTGSVMLLTPDGTQYRVLLADGEQKQEVETKTIQRDSPLIAILEEDKKELTKYDVIEDPKFSEVSEPCAEKFEALHASLMVPLVYQDQVIGSLNLGEKKSGKFYNREDIDLLRTLAHQGAVAIENARLFEENLEKQRMEEELNIARDLQMSMLPAECPVIKGLDIAAYSVSAREVGGDFYDFIEMGETKAGFVIADVTGKSVSGALVMSASRSVFRMLSEEHLPVSDSMIRANRRLKKDVKSGMFVALLFAVMDSQEKKLTLCSAGQTQPVLMSAKTSQATLVDTEGDTFPLGILEDVNYEETQLQLEPGDRVVFYTDGIVEAMNAQEEMYGFEKLQEVVKSSGADTAEALMNEIIESVKEFTGDAPQHDDITVIVMGVAD